MASRTNNTQILLNGSGIKTGTIDMADFRNGNGNLEQPLIKTGSKISDVKKIVIVYSYVKREFFPTEQQYITEKDAEHDAEIIVNEVKKTRYRLYFTSC